MRSNSQDLKMRKHFLRIITQSLCGTYYACIFGTSYFLSTTHNTKRMWFDGITSIIVRFKVNLRFSAIHFFGPVWEHLQLTFPVFEKQSYVMQLYRNWQFRKIQACFYQTLLLYFYLQKGLKMSKFHGGRFHVWTFETGQRIWCPRGTDTYARKLAIHTEDAFFSVDQGAPYPFPASFPILVRSRARCRQPLWTRSRFQKSKNFFGRLDLEILISLKALLISGEFMIVNQNGARDNIAQLD